MRKLSVSVVFFVLQSLALSVHAAQCTDVFAGGLTDNLGDNGLDLSTVPWQSNTWPASGTTLAGGDYYFGGDDRPEDYSLQVASGEQVRIFVSGSLTIGNKATLGSSGELLLVVQNNLVFGNNVTIDGLIYAGGQISRTSDGKGNAPEITGAVASSGNITPNKDDRYDVTYDSDLAQSTILNGLCEVSSLGGLPVFDNFESYAPGGSINGNNGGSNWGGPWTGQDGQVVVDTSDNPLEFVDSEDRRIRSATSLEIFGNGSEVVTRPLDGTFSGDSVFLSMLVRFNGDPTNNDFVGFWVENSGFGASPQFGLKVNEGGGGVDDFFVRLDRTADYSTDIEVGETYLLVAQYTKGTEDYFSNAKLWVNPECTANPPAVVSAQRNSTNNQLREFSRIGVRSENLSGSDALQIGQVAVGTRWSDVVKCSPGPLVEYRLEQASLDGSPGEIIDTSVNGNNATSGGGLSTRIEDPAIAGNPGTCRYGDFDGVDDLVTDTTAGDYLNGLEAVTVMAWVYNTDELAGNDRGVFFTDDANGQDNRLGLRYDTDGLYGDGNNVIKASVFTDECNTDQECLQVETISDVMVRDRWQHLAMTWTTDGEIKVYVDGTEVETSGTRGSGGTGALAGIERLDIGEGAKGDRWQGRIDEFRIYGVALTEAEIMAEMSRAFPCSGFGPDHIRLSHPGEGLTCSSSQITVSACANEDCSELFGDPVEVELTSPLDGWTPNPVTFTGTADVDLSVTQPSTVSLDANAVAPSAQDPTRCFNGGAETCEMTFFDAGFVIDVPDHVSAANTASTIAAVRKDEDSQQCVPGFSNVTRDVGLWSSYANPATGSESVRVDSATIAQTSPGTSTELQFDANGVATFDLSYPDVGRLALNARYEGSSANNDEGLIMTGTTEFIARPDRFRLDIPGNPAATNASGGMFSAAGEAFEVTVSALNANDDLTPNFGQEITAESVRLESSLVAPAGGDNPPVTGTFGAFGEACDGSAAAAGTACGEFNWPEVGIIALTPRLASGSGYLGTQDVVGTRLDHVGRFVPARFDITVSEQGMVAPFCTAGLVDFAYTGQDLNWESGFEPIITAEARTALGGVARNYTLGGFMKLDALDLERTPAASDVSVTNAQGDPFPVTATLSTMAFSNLGAGRVQYVFSPSDIVRFDKTIDSKVAPFTPDYAIALTTLEDSDLVSAAPQTPVDIRPSFGFETRYGRLNLENAYGPEISELTVPFNAEYYTGTNFTPNVADSCWVYNTGADVTLDDSGLSGGSSSVDSQSDTLLTGEPPSASELVLTAPGEGNTGDVGVTFSVPVWLQADFDGDGTLENPSALATFGVYRGNDRIIYWQEVLN